MGKIKKKIIGGFAFLLGIILGLVIGLSFLIFQVVIAFWNMFNKKDYIPEGIETLLNAYAEIYSLIYDREVITFEFEPIMRKIYLYFDI